MQATGSLLPLSTSKSDARDPSKFNFCDLSIAKTDAASVELTTAPISNDSKKDILNINYTNTPVIKTVIIVPNVDIKIEGAAFGLAMLQLVPNPP